MATMERRMTLPAFIQIILVIVVLALVIAGAYIGYQKLQNPITIPTNAIIVTQVQQVGKLETATYTLQQIIVYDQTTPWYEKLFGSSKKLFVVYGTVTAGIDLSQLNQSDVQVQGKKVTLNMPAPYIMNSAVDPTRTQVYDADTGAYSIFPKNLGPNTTIQILAAAQKSQPGEACRDGILQQAASSAKTQLTSLLKTTGFTTITIDVPTGTCG